MKALDKERGRRYETAIAFAEDIARYLESEPVTACPPSAYYRLRKFAVRNRQVLTVCILSLGLLVGLFRVFWRKIKIARGLDRAKEAADAKYAAVFMNEIQRLGLSGDIQAASAKSPVSRSKRRRPFSLRPLTRLKAQSLLFEGKFEDAIAELTYNHKVRRRAPKPLTVQIA